MKRKLPDNNGNWPCSLCREFKPASLFHASKATFNGLKSRCIDCTRSNDVAWRYGLVPERYLDMLEKSAGLCAICGQSEQEFYNFRPKSLAIDHDHNCCPDGRSCGLCVRDLICSGCNTGYGLTERPDLLRAKADYLERWQPILQERYQTAGKKVERHGTKIPGRQGLSRLTPENVKSILESDESHVALAARYGVHRSAISAVKTRRTWKQVEHDGKIDLR